MAIPLGVYRGRGCGIGPINTYETFLGRTVDYVLDFMVEAPTTWAQFETGLLTGSTTIAAWTNQLGSRKLVLGVPACCMGTTWATEASGANDTHWKNLGNALVAAGLANAVLRIGREFNGSWYPWKVVEGNQTNYINGYTHIVNTLKTVTGQAFRFNWNPYLGVGNLTSRGTESCYPGNAVVDEIGLDVYDYNTGAYPTVASSVASAVAAAGITANLQRQVVDTMLTEWDSVRGWYGFALSKGKPLVFPEWGLRLWRDANVYKGGGDNAELVRAMYLFMKGMSQTGTWAAMWEDPALGGMGVSDPDTNPNRQVPTPMARATFLRYFA
jgi:hypothetical protein